jgi:hypothetical protein
MKNNIVLSVKLLLLAFCPVIMEAQWSNDPAENTAVSDTDGILSNPHVAMTTSGNSYISWYSATEGLRFDVYLQNFGIAGNKLWEQDGLLVSAHPTFTWVTDYGLAVDNEGYAILAFQDKRDDVSNAFAYRISPDGVFNWGEDGMRLTDSPDNDWWPQVVVTGDNDFIFIYSIEPLDTTQSWKIGFQKLDAAGNVVWDENILTGPELDYYMPQMLLTEQGNLIVSWLAKTSLPDSVPGQPNYFHVYLQKFNHDGQPIWSGPVQADTGNLMSYNSVYTIPYLTNNGADGAYVIWQSVFLGAPTIRVNDVGADGQVLWQENGIQVETSIQQQSISPSVLYDPADDHLYVFYLVYEYASSLDCWSIGGQKFSAAGDRLWGDQPKLMVPLMCSIDSIYMVAFIKAAPDGRLCLFYEKTYKSTIGPDTINQSDLFAGLVDTDGNYVWPGDKIPVSTVVGYKGYFTAGDYSEGQWITAWADNRQHPFQYAYYNIYAQNISIDGTLGPLSVEEPYDAPGPVMTCYPNPAKDNLYIQIDGLSDQNRDIEAKIYNIQGKMILEGSFNRTTFDFDIKSLDPGIYIIKVRSDKCLFNKKLIVY